MVLLEMLLKVSSEFLELGCKLSSIMLLKFFFGDQGSNDDKRRLEDEIQRYVIVVLRAYQLFDPKRLA